MAELKTKKTNLSVDAFFKGISDKKKREDCYVISNLMKKLTKSEPVMWGSSIVGFGNYLYKYDSGREMDWFPVGFSPRKQNLTLYIIGGFTHNSELLRKLGKYKTGKGCLYIKQLEDVDLGVLKELIKRSLTDLANIKK